MRRTGWRAAALAALTAVAVLVVGCSGSGGSGGSGGPGTSGGPSTSGATGAPGEGGATSGSPSPPVGSTGGDPTVTATLVRGLDVPWGVAFLPDGSALVAQRPTGQIVRVGAEGGMSRVGTVPGVAARGEGGLLGLAVMPADAGAGQQQTLGPTASAGLRQPVTVFAYLTTSSDNRVVRMTYDGATLGRPTPVLTGIPSASFHNGGLVTVGPDGKLWIGTGEGGVPDRAQDRSSLGGKILRIDPDGSIPADNPFAGSPVYSLGHRNVQGLAFDSVGQPWATEFGQNTWDELNRIVPGGNYGWPVVEGKGSRAGYVSPLVQWSTDEASPSGLAIVDDVAYLGALRGARLWRVPLLGTRAGEPESFLDDEYGRLRTVAATPSGDLWVTTSNRDGRGSPQAGDDRILLVQISSATSSTS